VPSPTEGVRQESRHIRRSQTFSISKRHNLHYRTLLGLSGKVDLVRVQDLRDDRIVGPGGLLAKVEADPSKQLARKQVVPKARAHPSKVTGGSSTGKRFVESTVVGVFRPDSGSQESRFVEVSPILIISVGPAGRMGGRSWLAPWSLRDDRRYEN
jgi:hypothetical protein